MSPRGDRHDLFGLECHEWNDLLLRGDATNSVGTSGISVEANALPVDARQAWRLAHFGQVANTGNAANSADPDHDGETTFWNTRWLGSAAARWRACRRAWQNRRRPAPHAHIHPPRGPCAHLHRGGCRLAGPGRLVNDLDKRGLVQCCGLGDGPRHGVDRQSSPAFPATEGHALELIAKVTAGR